METIVKKNEYQMEDEDMIYDFMGKLETGEYKVILCNGQTPILEHDVIVDLILHDLNNDSRVESIEDDMIIIHKEKETIELKGYKEMSNEEIFARRYLDKCECGLIIKDSLEQVELREDNFVNSEYCYIKCKDIVNIRTVAEDNDHYKMNWDCIIVEFDNGIEEIWQRN